MDKINLIGKDTIVMVKPSHLTVDDIVRTYGLTFIGEAANSDVLSKLIFIDANVVNFNDVLTFAVSCNFTELLIKKSEIDFSEFIILRR